MVEEKKLGRGRPRVHDSAGDRMRAWRQRQRRERMRLDGYISSSAAWRLRCLATAWGCGRSAAIERLLVEADRNYGDILFPGNKNQG